MKYTLNKKLCPIGLKNNPNKSLRAIRFITIHCTGNYAASANAKNHAEYLYGDSGGAMMSWHYTVDKDEVWQSFEDDRACWHAGDGHGDGNMASIGIEICVNDKAGFPRACDNAARLVADLLKKHGLPIDRVVQHNRWSGKDCPKEIRAGLWGVTWDQFIEKMAGYLQEVECVGDRVGAEEDAGVAKEMIYNYVDENMPAWARPTVEKLVRKGYLQGNEKGELGLNETMLKVFVVNDRAGLYG